MIRRSSSIIICLILLFAAAEAAAGTKIDPYLDIQGSEIRDQGSGKTIAIKSSDETGVASRESRVTAVEVFIKSSDVAKTREAVVAAAGAVHMVSGDIMVVALDAGAVKEIAERDEVVFIEAAKPVQLKNDLAGADIKSVEVHTGTDLPAPYSGKGIIVGLIDTGIDYRHADFLDGSGKNRILAIWDQTTQGGVGPSEIGQTYGTECDADSIAGGTCSLRDLDGHGTHVAGTMASRNDTYGGVAPDARIVAVVYDSTMDLGTGYAETIFSTKICEAAYYVFKKAEQYDAPAVVNLSLGTHIGAHDGMSLFEECLAGLVRGTAGRAIVAAAGNEYSTDSTYTGIHAGFDVDGEAAANFVIRAVSRDRIYYVDFWGEKGGALDVGLAIHKGEPGKKPLDFSGLAVPGERLEGLFLKGEIEYSINTTDNPSALNGKQHVGVRIVINPSLTNPSQYSFDLVVKGKGAFDAWLFPDKPSKTVQFTSFAEDVGGEWKHVAGDRVESVAIPATSPDIIAVAGYTTRNSWDTGKGCCRVSYELEKILPFSGSGPSSDPASTGLKPQIAAPGGMIASTLSSDAIPNALLVLGDGRHMLQAGTSMSAPFVSGTIALMFEANPNFTQADVTRYITKSALVDGNVGDVPNDRWGYGKLDSLAAIETALSGGASGTFSGQASAPPPSQGGGASSGGCMLVVGSDERNAAILGMFVAMLAALLILKMGTSENRI